MSTIDIRPFIRAKSDQLNADDLVGGDIVVQIKDVRVTPGEQPVTVVLSGGHMPWRASKTGLREVAAGWGTDANAWIGRWVKLFRDSSVKWGGAEVGGIRVRALSHIDKPVTVQLAETRGKKKAHVIAILPAGECRDGSAPTANLDAFLAQEKLTTADVDRWLASTGKPSVANLSDTARARLAATLAAEPEKVAAIRSLIPTDTAAAGGGEE